MSEYTRLPIQSGCTGVLFPTQTYLTGTAGLAPTVSSLSQQPGNLAALTFFPIGSKKFSQAGVFGNGQYLVLYGPTGVTLTNLAQDTVVNINADGVTINIGDGATVKVNGGNVVVSDGDVIADGISLKTHVHGGVATGSGDTGPPVA
jgi:hypothetical protein